MENYSFDDLEDLACWLDQPNLPDAALSLGALDGYLVAIATHAPNLASQFWLPPIWGYAPGARIAIDPASGDRDRSLELVIQLHRAWLLRLHCPRDH